MFSFVLFSLFLASPGFSADTIVVTATKSATGTGTLPYSVGVVEGSEWRDSGESPERALSRIPGLSFSAAGGPGQTRYVFLRGAKSEQTLVLVDGMVVNDPLSTGRTFDFGHIPVNEIERIEVVKGPQSVLYGSDAMGGVIHIITKKSTNPRAALELGSYQSMRARAAAHGFRAGFEQTKGFSAADERMGNSEPDGHRSWTIGGHKEFSLREDLSLRAQADFEDSRTDTDSGGGSGADRFGTFTRGQQMLARVEALWLKREDLEYSLAASLSTNERENNTAGPAYYKASLVKTEGLVRKKLSIHHLTGGIEGSQEAGRSSELFGRRRVRGGALYVQDQFGDRLHGTAGARLDWHSQHKSAKNARGGLGYWIFPEVFRVKGSVGTGYKAPSIYQVYSIYGRENLRPERSIGGDAGLEWVGDEWGTEVTAFGNRFRDMIDFDSVTSKYFNLKSAQTYGVEWAIQRSAGFFTVRNAFTFLRTLDRETRLPLTRRPRYANNLEASLRRGDFAGASLQLRYVGRRADTHPNTFTRQSMPAFATVDANLYHRIAGIYRLRLRGENLLNRHYQENSGYGTPARSAYLGVEADW